MNDRLSLTILLSFLLPPNNNNNSRRVSQDIVEWLCFFLSLVHASFFAKQL
jgi:hypothetical protein